MATDPHRDKFLEQYRVLCQMKHESPAEYHEVLEQLRMWLYAYLAETFVSEEELDEIEASYAR